MLDGRVLGASQVEYKPFGKPPLKRESSVRLRKNLAKLRPPQAENSVAAPQLFNALPSSLALSAVHPRRRFLFLRSRSTRRRVRRGAPNRAARPCEAACAACRREAAGPSEQPQGRERPRPPTRRASPEAMPARAGRPLRKSS